MLALAVTFSMFSFLFAVVLMFCICLVKVRWVSNVMPSILGNLLRGIKVLLKRISGLKLE